MISILMALLMTAVPAHAEREESPCLHDSVGSIRISYDHQGRLSEVQDTHQKANMFVDYGPVITDVRSERMATIVRQNAKLNKKGKWRTYTTGSTHRYIPLRDLNYYTNTGKLYQVYAYDDDFFQRGIMTMYTMPDDEKLAELRDSSPDGVIRYNGPYEKVLNFVPQSTGQGQIEIAEPENLKTAECIPFLGHRIALKRPNKHDDSKRVALPEISESKLDKI